jgi:DNA (cytosine-5)-methyltransferase 1
MAKFISLFAGVGGFDLGMEQAGHECVAQVEWDKNAAGVLKHRWPNVPLFCDVSKVSADDLPDADFITYGFPCQDLSVAGKREGLDGKRSGLFYEATRLIRELRTRGCGLRFAVAENVGGLFSADDGVALARCIRELLDSGACETGWRLLDSQYFGVAQRRKRVFIVSDFGGESVDEILAITESLPGYPAPSREAGKGTAGDATKGVGEGGRGYRMTAFGEYQDDETASCMKSRDYKDATDLIAQEPSVVSWNGDTTPKASEDVSVTLRSQQGGEGVGVAFQKSELRLKDKIELKQISPTLKAETKQGDTEVNVLQGGEGVGVAFTASDRSNKAAWEGDISGTINCQMNSESSNLQMGVRENLTVRRLTPIECERLQGFPDNWTSEKMELILEGNEWKATGKVVKQADGPRYKAMGNAVTVNVAEWIGKQIEKVLNK